MYRNIKIVAAAITILAFSNIANAAGFALYEYSARGNAMGGAVMANKAEPASIAANPALITKLDGTQIQTGITMVTVDGQTVYGGQSATLKDQPFYLPHVYVTREMTDNVYFGLGIFPRYGLGGKYKNYETWPGATSAYYVNLQTLSFNPNIAVKVNEEFSFAMGLEIMKLWFKERKQVPGGGGLFVLQGESLSWGGNFGAIYTPNWAEKWAAALTYRAKVRHVATGDIEGSGAYAATTGDASAALTLPDSLALGISYAPTSRLTLEADLTATFWSTYRDLRVDYDDVNHTPPFLNEKKRYSDVFRFGIGGEYAVNDNWDVRLGYVYDESPINSSYMDTLVPADDRDIYSVGVGYHKDNWGVDVSYTHLRARSLKGTTAPGGTVPVEYKNGFSNMYAMSFKYAF
ncbi:long-chain fatty acid transport protein [Parelusimicrobium proximum]|uniref:OmpP1/FadL family transporter n=1 Tax=Parelusimicrobium proximum TaxID=3228953 RepID=UPI003D182999